MGLAVPVYPTMDSGWKTYGTGRLFLPAATNYCANPSFELDTDSDGRADGWSTWASSIGGTPVFTRVSALRGQGSYAQHLSYTGVAGDSDAALRCITDTSEVDSVAPGDVLTVSVDLLGSLSGTLAVIEVVWLKADGSSIISIDAGSGIDPTATVDRYSHTTAAAPALASRFRVGVLFPGIAEGDTVDASIDDVLVEKSSVLTLYFDGSYPDCAWTGTANASTSTRTASDLQYSSTGFFGEEMTVAGRTSQLTTGDLNRTLFRDGNSTVIFGGGWGQQWRVVLNYGDTASVQLNKAYAVGDVITYVGRYTTTTLDLSVNGTDATQVAHALGAPTGVGAALGPDGAYYGYVGPLLVSPTRKSDAWVAAIQADNGAALSNLAQLFSAFMAVGDVLFPWGGDSVGFVKTSGGSDPFEDATLAFDGNSLTVGYGSTEGHDYASLVVAALDTPVLNCVKVNAAEGGEHVHDLHGATVDAAYDPSAAHNICTVLCGQLDEEAPAVTVAALAAYCAARQVTGWQVVICTLPSYEWELEAAHVRTEINTLIRSGYAGWADALADLAADARIGDDGDYLDGDYFLDDIHLIDAGYAIIAGIVKTAIGGLL
jgi:hypothetical protein